MFNVEHVNWMQLDGFIIIVFFLLSTEFLFSLFISNDSVMLNILYFCFAFTFWFLFCVRSFV